MRSFCGIWSIPPVSIVWNFLKLIRSESNQRGTIRRSVFAIELFMGWGAFLGMEKLWRSALDYFWCRNLLCTLPRWEKVECWLSSTRTALDTKWIFLLNSANLPKSQTITILPRRQIVIHIVLIYIIHIHPHLRIQSIWTQGKLAQFPFLMSELKTLQIHKIP